ncbi:MAG: metallophosphoesterase [Candidatus Pacearchaeota archaeon]|nr:metallophosphoesterase [Candidatus Pacearchaeota archaeon]
MKEDIKILLSKGYLVEQNMAFLLSDLFSDVSLAEILLKFNPPKIITQDFFNKNLDKIIKSSNDEKFLLKIKEHFSLFEKEKDSEKAEAEKEIRKEFGKINDIEIVEERSFVQRKISVEDFIKYFRDRYLVLRNCLQDRDLEGLSSIGKISGQRRVLSVIGLVYDKKITKNRNILLELEDLTGKISVIVHRDKKELFEKASNVVLDEVIAVKGAGSNEIMFANDIILPDLATEQKKSPVEHLVAFTADLHVGSDKFLEENFLKFIDWLNGKIGSEKQKEFAKKVKYFFIVGDTVDGVGVYPGQEQELKIKDIEEQYKLLAEFLGRIRKDVTIIMCAGGKHDASCFIEPQPKIPKEIAPELYKLKNLIITTNPATIRIAKSKNFPGFNVLMYHGDSYDYYVDVNDNLRLNNAKMKPDTIIHFLLKKRHLAPSHTSTTYYPFEKDFLTIRTIPDIFVSGHIHKSAISHYNNIVIISCSCWQKKTAYQEKFGHEPDPCKVPILNLKTGKITVMDFS